jgi:CheY-like chemotaxis protein
MISTLSGYFVAKGERVLIARNGWEAFAQTREVRPDIIVMDIQMPEMDGLEAIRHIRSDQHGKSIPIIALTALAMPGDREQCLAAGADEYLSKPVSLRKLSETIEHFLSRKVQK